MTRAHLSLADAALLAAYFAFTLLVGFWRRRRTAEDFLVAGRSLGLPVFVATLVATWYGGILGVGEMTYRYGLANWTTQGLPYYVFALAFAAWLAPRVRAASLYTIPDKLAVAHGRPAALVGAVYAFLMVTPAPYVLMVGQILHVLTGIPLLPGLVLGTLASVAYVYVGGFQSDVRINVYQFALMFAGFAVALVTLAVRYGGPAWVVRRVPPEHLQLDGGAGWGYVTVWFFVALWTLIDPGFHQRCSAARTPSVARWGIVAAVGCWALFDVFTTSAGLYARAIMPDLPESAIGLAFPLLAERALPSGVKGLFYVAMLATVMSTVVSYTFLGAMALGRDVWWRLSGDVGDARVPGYTRWGLVLTSALAIAVAVAIPSVVRQWWAIGTVLVPGLLLPLLTAYAPAWRVPSGWTLLMMVGGPLASGASLAAGWAARGLSADVSDSGMFVFGVQPIFVGLGVAVGLYAAGLAATRIRHARA